MTRTVRQISAPQRTTPDILALIVTYVVSPLGVPPVATALAARGLGAGGREVLSAALVSLAANGLVPLAVLVWMRLRGDVASLEVRERSRRALPFAVGIAGSAVAAAGLQSVVGMGREVLAAIALWQAVNGAILWAITARWTKVSVHVYAVASVAAALAWLAATRSPSLWMSAVVLAALTVVVAWARWQLGAHTAGQVALGAVLGAALVPIELALWPG